ncbi:MAG: hypothetical protein AMJ64_14065 [Betaproteobacteria bacterium SG8_39]|nr:MAG: hypothetical protein AMJ64_14065 [Betaproteobacteria bacterium SG8_39]
MPPLDGEIAELTRVLNNQEVSEGARWIVFYYRGLAHYVLYFSQRSVHEPGAEVTARKALADFDATIEAHSLAPEAVAGVPAVHVFFVNAIYLAGQTSNMLGDEANAYKYYRRCAVENHAACLEITGWAMVTGKGHTTVDVDGAIAVLEKAYQHGTDFTCAAPFAAWGIAEILHFHGGSPRTVTALDWIERAHVLRTALEERIKKTAPCKAAEVFVSEYLIRLSRGEERRELLSRASELPMSESRRQLISYLNGDFDDATFRERASEKADKYPRAACIMYFYAWWDARARRQVKRMREYFDLLSTVDTDNCGDKLALARMGAQVR